MSKDRPDRPGRSGQTQDPPPYRVYRAGQESPQSEPARRDSSDRYGLSDPDEHPAEPRAPRRADRPYTTYRAAPRGLMERLRGEDVPVERVGRAERAGSGSGSGGGRGGAGSRGGTGADGEQPGKVRWWRRRWTPFRVLRWVVGVA